MLEMMIVLFIISILISISRLAIIPFEFDHFENEVLTSQLMAMSHSEKVIVNHSYLSNVNGLSFNHWGNINMAQTLKTKHHTYVFQLGAGRYDKK